MVCQICKDNAATLRFTEMKNNKSTELHVCQSCAEAKGISVQVGSSKAWHHEMFAKLVDDVAASDDTRVGPVQCDECGMKFSTFRETSRFGCASCYRSFEVKVIPILRRIHGNTRHVGKK